MGLIECVPNFSEGRRKDVIDEIKRAAEIERGALVLDCHSDPDHNRMVLTIVGSSDAVKNAVLSASAKAIELIDLRTHIGEHPRIGVVDVVPFVPLGETLMEECVDLANKFAKEFSERFSIPVFLYGEAAKKEDRRKLANIRSGQFEALRNLIGIDRERDPDFGPNKIHPTAGATAVGARRVLIAYNVDLASNDLEIAKTIAKKIRQSGGGLPAVQALGLKLGKRGIVQVSTNLTDYTRTSIASVFDAISKYASESNVEIADSEIVGLVPRDALPTTEIDHLRLINFSSDKIIENRTAHLQK
ncbi:MAG: glutamate formimidoyltransferase [Nitrososphaerales archaeon]